MKSYNRLLLASRLRITILLMLVFGFLPIVILDRVVPATANSEDTSIIFFPPRDVTNTSSITETEPSIAISPLFSDTLLVGMNTSESKMAAYLSVNGGESWQGDSLPNFLIDTGVGQSDPVVGFDTNGKAYIAGLSHNGLEECNGTFPILNPGGGIFVMSGNIDSGNVNWDDPVIVASHIRQTVGGEVIGHDIQDKPWLAIDTSLASPFRNRIYIAWTTFSSDGASAIRFAYSADGGTTFTLRPALAVGTLTRDTGVQGAYIAVGPEGDVYIAWYEGPDEEHPEVVTRTLYMKHSNDGGETFEPVSKIADVVVTGVLGTRYICEGLGRELNGGIRNGVLPSIAADPTNSNRVYAVWNGANSNVGGNSDIYLAFSDDRGNGWSDPLIVNNDSTNDQFMPSVTVDRLGTVFVEWYDRKNDPENLRFVPTMAFSRAGELDFEQRSLIQGSGFSGDYRVVYDYLQIAALPEGAVGAWVGDGDAHISFARYVQNTYAAFLISQSEYPVVRFGATTTLTFTLRNSGTVTWDPESFALMLSDGDSLGLAPWQPVPSPVSPNQDITWNLTFGAPQEPGIYDTHWQMAYQNSAGGEAETFGPDISYYVIVLPGDASPSLDDWIRLVLGYLQLEIPDMGFLDDWLQQIETLIQTGIEILLQLAFGICFVIALLIALPFIISAITNS